MRVLTSAILALAIVACQPGTNTHPTPSVAQIGSDLHCGFGDHGYEDNQAGWGFCYPGTWKYTLRSQYYSNPQELDLTFDITNVPCASAPPNTKPVCSPGAGLFAFMIVYTYPRAGAPDLATWVETKLTPPQATPSAKPSSTSQASPSAVPSPTAPTLTSIQWGNAKEAAMMSDGRRIALTPNQVVIMELRSGFGLLDLESEMSKRLGTWKFLY
jgi:hypothetical protein